MKDLTMLNNNMKQRNLNTVFANISKATSPTSDSFLLIMSYMMILNEVLTGVERNGEETANALSITKRLSIAQRHQEKNWGQRHHAKDQRSRHISRTEDNTWTNRLTEWQARTRTKRRGWEKRRWSDDWQYITLYLLYRHERMWQNGKVTNQMENAERTDSHSSGWNCLQGKSVMRTHNIINPR